MKIYLVFEGVDYEGSSLKGVYKNKDDAMNFVEEEKKEMIKESIEVIKTLVKDKESQAIIDYWSKEVEDLENGWRWNDKFVTCREELVIEQK